MTRSEQLFERAGKKNPGRRKQPGKIYEPSVRHPFY